MSKKKITVLYVHANNTDIGGADYCLFKLAHEIDKNLFRPIVCLALKTGIFDMYAKAGIKTYIIDMQRIKKTKNPLKILKLLAKFTPTIKRLREIIKNENVDIVHGNDLLDIYGPIAGRIARIPTVQHCRMILPKASFIKWMLTHITYYINHIIVAISNGVLNDMYSALKKSNPSKIIVCYDWYDFSSLGHGNSLTDIHQEFSIADEVPLIGVVGRLEPWKGQHMFIRAASLVAKEFPTAAFLVIGGQVKGRGRENYRKELILLSTELGIKDKVIFTGHRNDIRNIMSSLDVLVLSSVTPEPLGQVVMEASACGKPVVASDAGGPPEIIIHGKTGFLYPIGNYTKMAEKIIYLLKNPTIAGNMGLAGKMKMEQSFTSKLLHTKIENIYKYLIFDSK